MRIALSALSRAALVFVLASCSSGTSTGDSSTRDSPTIASTGGGARGGSLGAGGGLGTGGAAPSGGSGGQSTTSRDALSPGDTASDATPGGRDGNGNGGSV